MKISIFGTGYVGLVTGTCFSEMGNDVICADLDEKKVQLLKDGVSPIYEPGLEALVRSNSKAGRLNFTTDLVKAVKNSEFLFIAVGTPPGEDGSADLKYVLQVAKTIAQNINEDKIIINKSTVPVGTAAKIKKVIQTEQAAHGLSFKFDVVSNPEFLKEGSAIEDCLKPDRVVIGVESEKAKKMMTRLYSSFLKNGRPLFITDLLSSEMIKYAANSMLATRISFMNELSRLCEKVGADIEEVRQGISSDLRIGHQFLYAGLGYGGSCFPKDVKAFIQTATSYGEDVQLLKAVEHTNEIQKSYFYQKIINFFDGDLSEKKIAFWGLAFKPGTDDIREAPALSLIHRITQANGRVIAYDPVAMPAAQAEMKQNSRVTFAKDQYFALEGADALCIATEWKSFREPDFPKIKSLLKFPTIFDGRNIFNPEEMRDMGFQYISIGRPLKQIS